MIVVTGATGNVGRAVVEQLAAAGEQVVAVSRNAPTAALPDGVRHHLADLADPASLTGALGGAEALFLLVAGDDPRGVVDVAALAGVKRIVLLSSQGAGTRPDAYAHPVAFEQAVRDSGLAWTVLRPGGFATNTFQWIEGIRTRREVAAPFADVALPPIDPADIADVAVAVLTGKGHRNRVYELTGPEALSPRERAAVLAEVLGEPIRFVEQTRDEARVGLLHVMPEPVADATLAILGTPTRAEQSVTSDVGLILGRPARSFTDWAGRNIAAFR